MNETIIIIYINKMNNHLTVLRKEQTLGVSLGKVHFIEYLKLVF